MKATSPMTTAEFRERVAAICGFNHGVITRQECKKRGKLPCVRKPTDRGYYPAKGK